MAAVILYTDYTYCIYESLLETYTDILPLPVLKKAATFRNWQDKQAFILGRLLVWKGLKSFQYEDNCLNQLQISSYGKPYIDHQVFFNISHAGRYVICALNSEETGIDIEEIQPIELNDFNAIFCAEEKFQLSKASNPLQQFFKFWTIKESVIKAEGKGLSIPMDQVTISPEGAVSYKEKTWYVKEIDAFQDYCCVIATATQLTSLIVKKVNFDVAQSTETIVSLV
ncbi:4'-phosphopantetheinyl transferase superfamily protein [Rhodocytophaga rosea]|uniref:4'-phosphopantetheinyl transferase superfamily protein n=1 Tax=Rhodocytophaga rosea TaxID=2704465 RepID=A0A6C0GN36_9BACT|nr:4'-phosphopantetheinyl transferase superfamily protein [Rhodocytophaga rosea]QHT69347.1 4'-phosphopantetheinyl transferase superfamily protein [Rhodocytophaga rosea]